MSSMSADDTLHNETRIIVPVRNGGARWREAAAALRKSLPDPSLVVVVDSTSSDGSDRVASEQGFELVRIHPRTFNHGGTRQAAVEQFCQGRQFVIFLTQDAIVEDTESLTELLRSFSDPGIGAAYGRQLPHHDARPFGRHFTRFNYPAGSAVKTLADAPRLGIKTAYLSNSFAAYRIRALRDCGGFPSQLILGEDAYVAFQMLISGWAIGYCAEAVVRHSHDYSIIDEMQRYFDFGVLHAQLPDMMRRLGPAEGEGMRFVLSEARFMSGVAPWLLPQVAIRNAAKYVGYRLGLRFQRLPNSVRRGLSMTKGYWDGIPSGPVASR
jgi:rhamnosyltransferase